MKGLLGRLPSESAVNNPQRTETDLRDMLHEVQSLETVALALDLVEQSRSRVGTGKLNRLLKRILEMRGPSSKLGTFAKAY
jgi:hypothetical protein